MENETAQMLARALREILDKEARKRIPTTVPQGSDAVPTPYIPTPRQEPYTPRISGREASISLPANKGANFDAYVNYKLNPLKIDDAQFNGAGLRYRWDF